MIVSSFFNKFNISGNILIINEFIWLVFPPSILVDEYNLSSSKRTFKILAHIFKGKRRYSSFNLLVRLNNLVNILFIIKSLFSSTLKWFSENVFNGSNAWNNCSLFKSLFNIKLKRHNKNSLL